MFIPLEFGKINSFPLNTYAFSKSALNVYAENKNLEYRKKIVKNLKEGKINAVVTPNELSGLKDYLGEKKYEKIYKPIWESEKSKIFCVTNVNFNSPSYSQLYNLYINRNIHAGDLSIAIVAIEYSLPLITDDYHHWSLQQNFFKVYNERHSKEIAECLAKKEKRKYFEIYTSQDFCKLFLSSLK